MKNKLLVLSIGLLLAAETNAQITKLSSKLVFAEVHPWEGSKALDGQWLRWGDSGHNPDNNDIQSIYWPLNGPYSCGDCNYAATIGNDLKKAGVDIAVIDWINFYPNEKAHMENLLKCMGMPVVVLVDIEPGWTGTTYASAMACIQDMIGYANNPALYPNYYHDPVSGKPVYFIWDPIGVGTVGQWNANLTTWKSQGDGGIFITGGSSLDNSVLTIFDGFLSQNAADADPLNSYNWSAYKLGTGPNNQFGIGLVMPGFTENTICDNQNPRTVARSSQRFDQMWESVINANYNGNYFLGSYVSYHNDGEDGGLEPVSPTPPVRGNGYKNCGGRLPANYSTYDPYCPDFYLTRNNDWVKVFKGTATTVPAPVNCGAAAPANNDCANSISLTSGTSCNYISGSSSGGTESLAAITCNAQTGNADDDVWYYFVAAAATHTVTVQSGTGYDAVIDVRAGTGCPGTNISCADATGTGGTETLEVTGLTIGNYYAVRIYHSGAGGGTFQICITHTVATGILNNENAGEGMIIFPNPAPAAGGELNCEFSSNEDLIFDIEITDLLGQVLLTEQTKAVKGINTVKLNINSLSKGMYFIKKNNREQQTELKFVKE